MENGNVGRTGKLVRNIEKYGEKYEAGTRIRIVVDTPRGMQFVGIDETGKVIWHNGAATVYLEHMAISDIELEQ